MNILTLIVAEAPSVTGETGVKVHVTGTANALVSQLKLMVEL
jgi:hypothetical protein